MTQENKELLLKDLCARLPYGVKVQDELGRVNKLVIGNADLIRLFYNDFSIYGENALSLPFLRPMSSMTEEEKKELKSATCPEGTGYFNEQYLICPMSHFCEHISYDFMSDILNWLNAHHFDYRGLIEKGLAIEVTRDNNPYEKK